MRFNDHVVSEMAASQLADQCFGGSNKPFSAYMLFYDRCEVASFEAVAEAGATLQSARQVPQNEYVLLEPKEMTLHFLGLFLLFSV